ncbi:MULTISPECIES: HAD hydrolase family protein [Paenibacillus]|uniref:HAD hydrolase family protein n=1 Tax=Paenibacillus TaxID=44249 RepID=UPI00096E0D46|nr:HAD hydrolase family protein [Paenibacillus odorifer]OMD17273.1 hypothetical protein BJP50_16105 [Paenibacillus odorifer]
MKYIQELMLKHKIAIFDLDGTLLDSEGKEYSNVSLGLKHLNNLGIVCILATGRSLSSMTVMVDKIDFLKCFYPKFVCNDGNTLFDRNSREYKVLNVINTNYFNELYTDIKDFADCVIEMDGYLYANTILSSTKYCMIFKEIPRSSIKVLPLQSLSPGNISGIYVFPKKNRDLELEVLIISSLKNNDVEMKRLNLLDCIKIEVDNKSKAKGVTFLLNSIEKKIENAVSFGDYLNDICLLEGSGFGIAVSESVDQVIEIADYHLKESVGSFLLQM